MDGTSQAVLLLASVLLSFGAGVGVYWFTARRKLRRLENQAREEVRLLQETAQRDADTLRLELAQAARSDLDDERLELESERVALAQERESVERLVRRTKRQRQNNQRRHSSRTKRLKEREALLEKATGVIEALNADSERVNAEAEKLRAQAGAIRLDAASLQSELESEQARLHEQSHALSRERDQIQELTDRYAEQLEHVSGLSAEQAKVELQAQYIEEVRLAASAEAHRIRDEAKRTAHRDARKVVLTTMQRLAGSEVLENTVSVVQLPSDHLKGRIIGREGRNSRAFEAATGVDLLIDDTPGAVVISCFDPFRREIARIALERLVRDGRIHPANIERFVKRAEKQIDEEVTELGQRAAIDLKLHGLHDGLIQTIGRMRYRTSYGQNVLAHSIEVANIASILAAEMGEDAHLARRGALLHDIGKVMPESVDRPHALVGMEACKRFGENEIVCNAVGAHHDEIPMTSLISPIVQIADAISGARPGARRENYEQYLERLRDLEDIASSFDGVTRAFAIRGGREVRVIVSHTQVTDTQARTVAESISERIQSELRYPGQIEVVVIREVRESAVAH